MAAKRKAKAPAARAAVENLRPLVAVLRDLEVKLWCLSQQVRHLPTESDEAAEALLGRVYKKHLTRLRALGIVTVDPDSDDLREVLDALKVVARSFGADLGDFHVLPRGRPQIWTDDGRLYDMDGRKHVLRQGLRLNDDGSLASSPGSMRDW